jgi:hypothetical protein
MGAGPSSASCSRAGDVRRRTRAAHVRVSRCPELEDEGLQAEYVALFSCRNDCATASRLEPSLSAGTQRGALAGWRSALAEAAIPIFRGLEAALG